MRTMDLSRLIGMCALGAGAFVALAAGHSSAQAAKLQIATSGGSGIAAAAIAFQLGYFREMDLDVTLFNAGGGNNAVSTVVGGDAQIGIVGIRNASKPVEKGQALKLIAADSAAFSQYIVVRPDLLAKGEIGPASTLAEKGALLQNLKIGVNDVGGSTGEFARYALAAAGYGDRAATIININSSAARLTALKRQRIDAIVAQPPEPESAVAQGFGAVLVDPTRDLPEIGKIVSDVQIVRADFLIKNRSVIRNYLQAVDRARRLSKSDSATAKKAYYDYQRQESQGNGLDPKIADSAWKDLLLNVPESLATSREQYANAQRFFKIPASVTYEQFVDNSLAESISPEN
jgi:ABC-type nitrate/sulfonate/bicarbonate transport system substrate-binding protein